MRWWPPGRGAARGGRCVFAFDAERFAYVCVDESGRVRDCGLEQRGSKSEAEFQRRLRALGLPPRDAGSVLPLAAVQLLQIEAPGVRPEEMRAAARWQVKDRIAGRLEDLTLDVMVVGGDLPRARRQLFVAVAANGTIKATEAQAEHAGLTLGFIDIAETAQRNLQIALAGDGDAGRRATAALVRHADQVLLTICAGGELYHARRIEWETKESVPGAWASASGTPDAAVDVQSLDFVDYGAEPDTQGAVVDDAPRLVLEMQRSLDMWERTWPELPLGTLWVEAGADSDALVAALAGTLEPRVARLDMGAALPGWDELVVDASLRQVLQPVAGALLRPPARRS